MNEIKDEYTLNGYHWFYVDIKESFWNRFLFLLSNKMSKQITFSMSIEETHKTIQTENGFIETRKDYNICFNNPRAIEDRFFIYKSKEKKI